MKYVYFSCICEKEWYSKCTLGVKKKKKITDIKRQNVTAKTFETFKESSRMNETMLLWTVKLHSLLTVPVTSGEQCNGHRSNRRKS